VKFQEQGSGKFYYIPHPDELEIPISRSKYPEYFVIICGEEVGIFGEWYSSIYPVIF
jgi:hypothetical protein